MERGNSTQSLSSRESRGGSEMGSRYLVESGLYFTSFAATIFISALVIVGVLLMTLLISLTVMLQSCQTKCAGFVQLPKPSDDYDHCNIFVSHAELNSLEVDELSPYCKLHAIQYVKDGKYLRDLNLTILMAEIYFSSLTPQNDGSDVVLMDIDDFLPSNLFRTNLLQYRFDLHDWNNWVEEANHLAQMRILKFYTKLRASGWSLIFITRKPEKNRKFTIESLTYAGFVNSTYLIMRSDNEMQMETWEFFSRKRAELQNQGFRIVSVISSRMDALTGSCLGKRNFKLSNPIYYKLEPHFEGLPKLH